MSSPASTSERIFTTSTTAPLTTPSPAAPASEPSKPQPKLHAATAPKPVNATNHSAPTPAPAPARPATAATAPTSVSAAELATAYKWDACVENSLVKTGYGLVGAGLLSLLLFRSPAARAAVTGLGAGFGAGVSWVECKQTFAAHSTIKPQLSKFQLPIIPEPSKSSPAAERKA